MLPFLPYGKAGGLQIRRCQGLAVGFATAVPLAPWLWSPLTFATLGLYLREP
jgi:hypothetical protein